MTSERAIGVVQIGANAGVFAPQSLLQNVKFRALKRRMVTIREKLEKSRTGREIQTVERRKLDMPFISLAGYTSSGKMTLFNRLASESKEESPKLFTTLTTTTRVISFSDARKKVMLSDTVGFISRLPTYLVESFKSTLDELTYANLVFLILDVSEEVGSIRVKLGSCRETLNELNVDPKKILLVLNKIDLLKEGSRDRIEEDHIFKEFATVKIPAVRGDGLRKLRNRILEQTFRQ